MNDTFKSVLVVLMIYFKVFNMYVYYVRIVPVCGEDPDGLIFVGNVVKKTFFLTC